MTVVTQVYAYRGCTYYLYAKNSMQDIDLIQYYAKFPLNDQNGQSFALHVQEWEIHWSVQSQDSEI